ncbi:hypothetical protein Pelo_17560 [Pelomyxa schiedti]|nr:hypothetical protein Pelo_17560 [Pelomyxa schiedti]
MSTIPTPPRTLEFVRGGPTTTHNWDFINPHGGCGVRVTSCPFVHNLGRFDLLKSTSPTVWSQLMAFLVGIHSSTSAAVRLLALQGQSLVCFMWDTLAELLTERVTALRLRCLVPPQWVSVVLSFGLSPLCGLTSLGRRQRFDEDPTLASKCMAANSRWLGEARKGGAAGECGLVTMRARCANGPSAWDLPLPQYCGMALQIGHMCFDWMEPGQMAMLFIRNHGLDPTVVCVVVDVEHSVATSSLDICSSTTCVMPMKQGAHWELNSTLIMRRNGGGRVFVLVVRHQSSEKMYSVIELEEGTGLVRELSEFNKIVKTSQLSESTFCVFQVINGCSYQIWDCSSVETRMVRVVTLPECGRYAQIEDGFIYLVGYSGVTVYEVHTGSPIVKVEIVKWSGPLDFPLQISHV